MTSRDLLIEIGLEEMPARFVTNSMNQLEEKMVSWAKEHQLSFSTIKSYSTPRRLAVIVENLAEKQEDVTIEAKGPAKKIALSDAGEWSKAAQGFTRGQGASVEDIYFKEINGVEYAHVQKHVKGKNTPELIQLLEEVITGLHFPKNMRWGSEDLRYVRPIKWLTVLFGEEVVPLEIAKVPSSNTSIGHRFLGNKVEILHPEFYAKTLLGEYVIVDALERKEAIKQQLQTIAEENNWDIPVDEDLLEEVNNLVEYPTALYGKYDESFLSLPEEVLITSMKEHQRYFPVKNKEGKLLPFFITVRNGNHEHLDIVAKGNEKVLSARLSDAAFFFKEDEKLVIADAVAKLDKVVFHEEIGTTGEKVKRVRGFATHIANVLEMDSYTKEQVVRAGEIYKFDLISQMVYEFPELQGLMGERYALEKGETKEVAAAINEHYMPRSAEDATPPSDVGAILSVAEKLDTIVSFFAIGVIPTGSQDPYALRRQAAGVVQTIINKEWSISLHELFTNLINTYESIGILKRDPEEVLSDVESFFRMRLKNILSEDNISYDIVDAALDLPLVNLSSVISKAHILNNNKKNNDFKSIVESLSRVLNIAKKAENSLLNVELIKEEAEKSLYETYLETKEKVYHSLTEQNYLHAFDALASMQHEIDNYFDNTMVMADDELIKLNRLAQMKLLADVIKTFGDWNKILVK
ncbi:MULTISPECIES: glycine--tRNA ligase subunit beta [Bacillus]|uniref:glycine--tRNA ligase subunit beta n=1 Tax=Bacillus TaxID=1386 RepID=UPI000BB8010F|nr:MULTISPECIES: glycine--tRNA ligase subunit beta [Bacillus]